MKNSKNPNFGGGWTLEKLEIVEAYLKAFTTALKNTNFQLMYIDAFAGSGSIKAKGGISSSDAEMDDYWRGSALRALNVDDKPFDRLVFIEKNPEWCTELEKRCADFKGNRDCRIVNEDANEFLANFNLGWNCRGVIFFDPFGIEVAWETIKKIEKLHAFDMWLLFPQFTVARMLPRNNKPSKSHLEKIEKVFGDRKKVDGLYKGVLFEGMDMRDKKEHLVVYKNMLSDLFGDRFLDVSRTLKNSRNAPLYELFFCAGNERGAPLAKRIAENIIERARKKHTVAQSKISPWQGRLV